MNKLLTGLVGAALLTAAGAASATTWDFTAATPGTYGSPYTQNTNPTGGPTLLAWGTDTTPKTVDVVIKNGGAGENGLGLASDPTHDSEIGPAGAYITLMMPTAQTGKTYAIEIGSLADGDVAQIYEATGNTAAGRGTLLGTTHTSSNEEWLTVTIDNNDQYLQIVEGPSTTGNLFPNMLIEKIATVPVPEPAGLGLLGLGLVGLVALKRRKNA